MTVTLEQAAQERIDKEKQWAVPGTRRHAEMERADAQQGAVDSFLDGTKSTAAAAGIRIMSEEGSLLADELAGPLADDANTFERVGNLALRAAGHGMSLFGYRAGEANYDKEAMYDELTKDIPFQFHDDIIANDNIDAARRSRVRIMDDMARTKRMGLQNGGHLAMMAGSILDVDMPLTLLSGGALGAAKVAGATLRVAKAARLSPSAALRLSGSAQGINAGLQAGAVVGAADAYWRESADWTSVADAALSQAMFGGGLGFALKGDLRNSIKAAQDELHKNIAEDAASIREPLDVNTMPSNRLVPEDDVFEVDPAAQGQSIGAAALTARPIRQSVPVEGATPTNQKYIDYAREYLEDSGWNDAKRDAANEWWTAVATHKAANLTTSFFNRLYTSKAATANLAAATLFESANGLGRGRATSAVRMDNYQRRIMAPLGKPLVMDAQMWAKRTGNTAMGSGYHISNSGQREFNRLVMLERNARRHGRTSNPDPEVARAADRYDLAAEQALMVGKGRDGETPLDGMEHVTTSVGYTPQRWRGDVLRDLFNRGVVTKDSLVQDMADAYRRAGMGAGKDAEAVAKAVIARALDKDADVDMSVFGMLIGDGKDFLEKSLILAGTPRHEVDQIMDRLVGSQHNRRKEGFAKTRNDIDLETAITTTDGSTLQIVDLLDQDLSRTWQRYARGMAGSSALARNGITNRAHRREFIDAVRAEQRALGEEPIPAEEFEAMLSHFDAGPVQGYGLGQTANNKGIGDLALAKRATGLALLNKLGIPQLAETGATIAQAGISEWAERALKPLLNKELAKGNQQVLDDLAFFTGEIGKDHWHFAPWMDLDDVATSDRAAWFQAVNNATTKASFVQGYTSAFNHVRSWQQRTAALAFSDKVMRTVKDAVDRGVAVDDATMRRFETDFGLDATDVNELERMVNSGQIEFGNRNGRVFVNRLNMDQWDVEFGERFAAAMTRNMNQLVQKSMAGEQDAWMHTYVGSVLTHLKAFPLQAFQKQFMRQVRHSDNETLMFFLYGSATSATALYLRDLIDGKDTDFKRLGFQAMNYSNGLGWFGLVSDPALSLLGLDDYRINPYGPHYDWTPPVVKTMNDLPRGLGAVRDTLTGDADWHDQQAIKALPFANAYGMSRLFEYMWD